MNPFELDPQGLVDDPSAWSAVASDIRQHGYSVLPGALPIPLAVALLDEVSTQAAHAFKPAGVGRQTDHQTLKSVRRDQIQWIEGDTPTQRQWLAWCENLKVFLNRELLLGLFSFESHFAHYKPGAFYRTHVDAFRGQANRVLSLVAYLNPDWQADDGGELVIYSPDESECVLATVRPEMATVVAFLSEEFPHEVLPAQRDRYSLAGWFRLNTSIGNQIDPPT